MKKKKEYKVGEDSSELNKLRNVDCIIYVSSIF